MDGTPRSLRRLGPPLALALATLLLLAGPRPVDAQTAPAAQGLGFEAARQLLMQRSDRLAAAQAATRSAALRADGVAGLGGPVVSLSGTAYAYNANLRLDTQTVNQRIGQIEELLPIPLPLPTLPSPYTVNRQDSGSSASVSLVWPLYTGGLNEAAHGLATARADEARADAGRTSAELSTLLVQRYFGAQLAARAASLRESALDTISRHDRSAQRMLEAGVISRVERLQALSALEDARRNAQKARDDADLAATALARLIHHDGPVRPSSPLFVNSQPLEPLARFVEAALQHHPGLALVTAKRQEALQLHAAGEAGRRPQVFAFGQRELRTGQANWVAGIGVRYTLWEGLDRRALSDASLQQVEQAERSDAQARNDIALLVEKNWLAVEQARRQFLAMAAGIELAQEVLRLRQAGLREGTSTPLDLIDAQVNLAKVQTEQAQAANDYVTALAQLLESSGQSDEFPAYMARADVKVQ